MKELFPARQVMGFVFSLLLTAIALTVYFFDLSITTGLTILLVTAFVQAALQLFIFMHAGETKDKTAIYTNLTYGFIIGIITIFGTLLTMIWDM